MRLVRWEPFRALAVNPFGDSTMFGDFDRNKWPEIDQREQLAPAVDVYEGDSEVILKADLPEFDRKNMSISIENNVLTLKGEKKFEEEAKKENYHRIERSYGSFARSFNLPNTIDQDKVKADYKDGVLKITFPKKAEHKSKQITVTVD